MRRRRDESATGDPVAHDAQSHHDDENSQAVRRNIAALENMVLAAGSSADAAVDAPVGDQDLVRESLATALAEEYELLDTLGVGGQGRVFRAVQRRTGKTVAIKCLHGGYVDPARSTQRFDQEIASLARLQHPNIVSLIDCGQHQQLSYAVMEFVAGREIDTHCRLSDLDPRGRVALVAQICDAVQFAHDNAVLHRDLKPSNIIVDHQGTPRLLDLGLAKFLDQSHDGQLTATGQAVGSIYYWSPEQSRGRNDIDVRSDVYSLGMLLFYLLTDTFPERRESLQAGDLLKAVRADARDRAAGRQPFLPHAAQVNADLDAVVTKALRFNRDERFASVRDLAADLRSYLANRSVMARGGRVYRLRKFLRRHWVASAAATMTVATVAAAIPTLLYAADQAEQGRIAAERTAVDALALFDAAIESSGVEMARLPGGQAVYAQFLQEMTAYLPSLAAVLPADQKFDLSRANLLQSQAEVALAAGRNSAALELLAEAATLRLPSLDSDSIEAEVAADQLATHRLQARAAANPWDFFEDGVALVSRIPASCWRDQRFVAAYFLFECDYAERLRRAGRDRDAAARYAALAENVADRDTLQTRQQILLAARQAMLAYQTGAPGTAERVAQAVNDLNDFVTTHPEDIPVQIERLHAEAFRARAVSFADGESAALAILETAIDDARTLTQIKSDRQRVLPPLGALLHLQADYRLRIGEHAAALESLADAVAIAEELTTIDPTNVLGLRRRQQLAVLQCNAALQAGDTDVAREFGEMAVDFGEQLLALDNSNAHFHRWHASAVWQLGKTFNGHDNKKALTFYQKSLASFQRAAALQGSADLLHAAVISLINTAAAAIRVDDVDHDQQATNYLNDAEQLLAELDQTGRLEDMDSWRSSIRHAITKNRAIVERRAEERKSQ